MGNKVKISVFTSSIRPKGLEIVRESLMKQTFKDFEWLCEINWTGKHDLNQSNNRSIKRAKGELLVSIQDYTKIEPDALEKIWNLYQENPDTFFTFPVGKVNNLKFTGSPNWDWRTSPLAEMDWNGWEMDFGACPKEAMFKIGGFDEEIDGIWAGCNLNVAFRADLAGYKFKCVPEIRGIAYDHDAFEPHPFRAQYKPLLVNMRMDEFKDGLKIDFLNS